MSPQTKAINSWREKRDLSSIALDTLSCELMSRRRRNGGTRHAPGFCVARHTGRRWDFPLPWERWRLQTACGWMTGTGQCPHPPHSPPFQRMAEKIFFPLHSASAVCIRTRKIKTEEQATQQLTPAYIHVVNHCLQVPLWRTMTTWPDRQKLKGETIRCSISLHTGRISFQFFT